MKILAIEPHADDLFISVGEHLKIVVAAGHEVTALTVYGDARRSAETCTWGTRIGIQHHITLGLPESGDMDRPVEDPALELPEYDQVWYPLGLRHQEHFAVIRAIHAVHGHTYPPHARRYLDMPYAVKQKHRQEAAEAVQGREIASLIVPSAQKWKDAELFKSQSAFFYFEQKNLLRCWEMLVR